MDPTLGPVRRGQEIVDGLGGGEALGLARRTAAGRPMSASTFVRLMLSPAAAASAAAADVREEGAAPDLGHPLAQPDELRADRDELGRRTRGGEERVGDRRRTLPRSASVDRGSA